MDAVITNIRTGLSRVPDRPGLRSRVVLESTVPVEHEVVPVPGALRVWIPSAPLNMPDCSIPVYDGVVTEVRAASVNGGAMVDIRIQHDVPVSVRRLDGMPSRVEIAFDCGPAYSVLRDRLIAIDPGHGGRDRGGRGPVNLLEKDVVLDLAIRLRDLCAALGVNCFVTRDRDVFVPMEHRVRESSSRGADVFLSLHAGVERDPAVRGARAAYLNAAGRETAGLIVLELARRLLIPDRGIRRERLLPPNLRVPAVKVEFVTISNPVDEGLVRSCTFMERAALAVLNGVKDFFWGMDLRRVST
ncbi:MAG: N-acetylmuramoyl-L-alanine amidase [Firmicutes bacterium]|nr:N-acetylmuramoyl-L-alanine amidase [Bacillota bacterium]